MAEGEDPVLYSARPTRVRRAHWYFLGSLFFFGAPFLWLLKPGPLETPILFTSLGTIVAWLLGFLGFVLLMREEFRRLSTKYVVTRTQVVRSDGILWRATRNVLVSKITRIEVHQGILGRLGGFGDLFLDTGDEDILILEGIKDPRKVETGISKVLAGR